MAVIAHRTSSFTITAAGLYSLGTGSNAVSSVINIQFSDLSSFSGSIAVKARNIAAAALYPSVDTVAPVGMPYTKWFLNGSAGDGTTVTTGITGNSLIQVISSGMEIVLDVTYTSGTMSVYFTPAAAL